MGRLVKWLIIATVLLGLMQVASAPGNSIVAVLLVLGLILLAVKLIFGTAAKLLGREATGFVIGTYVVRAIDRLFSRRQN